MKGNEERVTAVNSRWPAAACR
ncbi:uncharacterized protein G2W53_001644 [Senna tora]|uniref:Uncharacterized protein n=1 Tax=Senna tora TaxID=362788 RepID=A0A835CJM1_9FABA|nr:uncharacterized protein G2W53_001644 [Senna tora]